MCYKMLTVITEVLLILLTTGCSILEQMVYRPDIHQGNFFTPNDISKIFVGMTKIQVAYIMGTPMMIDPFGTNTWFYVLRQQIGRKNVIQQTLTLTFNKSDILINIDYKPALIKSSNN